MPTILNGIGVGYSDGTTGANATHPVLKAIHGKVGVGAAAPWLTKQSNWKKNKESRKSKEAVFGMSMFFHRRSVFALRTI
jgi:hypothetical protein